MTDPIAELVETALSAAGSMSYYAMTTKRRQLKEQADRLRSAAIAVRDREGSEETLREEPTEK